MKETINKILYKKRDGSNILSEWCIIRHKGRNFLFCAYIERWFQLHIQEQSSVILDAQIRMVVTDEKADPSELRRRLLLLGWQEDDPLTFLKLDAPLQPYSINTHLAHSLKQGISEMIQILLFCKSARL